MKSLADWEAYKVKLEKEARDLENRYDEEVRPNLTDPSYIDLHDQFGRRFSEIDRELTFSQSEIALSKLAAFDLYISSQKVNPALWETAVDDEGEDHRYLSELGHAEARAQLTAYRERQDLKADLISSQRIARYSLLLAFAAVFIAPILATALDRYWPQSPTEIVIVPALKE